QNLLLALGVGLLGVAAVIFVAVSWGRLGVGGRAAVLTAVTVLSAVGARQAARRGLTATAEAVSLLTVALALLDCAGARASDLFGLRDVDGTLVASGSVALVAAAAAAGSHALPTRALRLSGALLGQLAVPLLAVHLADTTDHPAAVLAAGLTAQALGALALVVLWPGSERSRDARLAVGAGALVAATFASALAAGAAYAEDGSVVVGTALLLMLAAGAGAAAEALRRRVEPHDSLSATLRGVAAALLVAGVWAPVVDVVPERWLGAALAGSAAALLALALAVPEARREVPVGVLLAATCLPLTTVVQSLAWAVAGRLQWPGQAWSADPERSARELLDAARGVGAGSPFVDPDALLPAVLALAVVAAALALVPYVATVARPARPVALPVGLAAAWLVPVAGDAGYPLALGWDLGLAAVALLGGAVLVRVGRTGLGGFSLASGSAVVVLALAWSAAADAATLTALPVASSMLLGVLALTSGRALRGLAVAAAVPAGLLLVGEVAAVARYQDAGWDAVTALSLGVLAAAAATCAVLVGWRSSAGDAFWVAVRRCLGVSATAAALADTAAVCWWQGVEAAGAGLAVAVAAALVLAATTLPLPSRMVDATDLRSVAAAGLCVAVPVSALEPDRLWVALLAAGVAVALLGLRVDHRWGWLSGLLLAASSWVRLAMSDVTAPEAYTVPPALALLAAGAWRRHRDPEGSSWRAYAPGLALALVPSLLRAVTDAGQLRPLLLGLAALAVIGLGVARRLQAPLVIGGAVLAVDALVQLAPYLAAAYDAVPRWVTIGAVGLLLLGAGATYERRVQDLRRVGRHVARLG
ncbi:MAG TPA: hypothetical protein VF423_00325, partial [Actinomycetes bacterium]